MTMQWLRGLAFRCACNPLVTSWIDRLFPPRSTGERGERLAERLLRSRGYITIARNYRTARGEVDLVMVDGREVVFVEVKTWDRCAAGDSPADAVDERKQRSVSLAAVEFLKQHQLIRQACRFDVVAITLSSRRPEIRHFRAAFESPVDW